MCINGTSCMSGDLVELEGCKVGYGWSSTKCAECTIVAENIHNCNT